AVSQGSNPSPRYFGKYRGVVKDNADPKHRGRLKVLVPAVLGDVRLWAMPCVPFAGNKVGLYCLPEKEDGVWVEFEGGDPSYPIWTGCYWAHDELPHERGPEERVLETNELVVRLVSGDEPRIVIEIKEGANLTLDGEHVQTLVGETSLLIDTGTITAEAAGGAKVELSGATTSVNQGALEVE
ncbi:MAG: hypothetical protein KC731_33080, partial [Myxococcales bacterium]|nr:hypothetical protein [Myxococcales bacterium]